LLSPGCAHEIVTIGSCFDGDTCRTSEGEQIRLACIDTPEMGGKRAQPQRARDARDRLRSLVVGKSVSLQRISSDRYGRTVGDLFVEGMNVQQVMVASRHARIGRRYAHQCPGLADVHMSLVNPCLVFSNSGGRSDKVSDWPARQARIHQVWVADTSTSMATMSGSAEPASRSFPAIQRNESRCLNDQQQLNG